jgi:hypothetical protein
MALPGTKRSLAASLFTWHFKPDFRNCPKENSENDLRATSLIDLVQAMKSNEDSWHSKHQKPAWTLTADYSPACNHSFLSNFLY